MGMVPDDRAIRNNVGHEDRTTSYKGVVADPAPLVDRYRAAEPDLISHRDVTANMRVVRDHAFVAEDAIMGRMSVRHEQAIGADLGETAMFWRPGVQGRMLAHDRAGADFQSRVCAWLIAENLWGTANHRARIDFDLFSQLGTTKDGRFGVERNIVAQHNIRSDISQRTNGDIGAKLSARFNDRGGVDGGGHFDFFFGAIWRCIQAISRRYWRSGFAGTPPQVSPAGMSLKMPAEAASLAPAPICT